MGDRKANPQWIFETVKGITLNTNAQIIYSRLTEKLSSTLCYVLCILLFAFSASAQAAFPDPLVNTATATVPAGVTDPTSTTGGVNTATDSNALSLPSIAIAKAVTANADEDGSGNISEGDTLTYTVTATNDGTSTLNNVAVVDSLITPTGGTTDCATVAPLGTCTLIGTYVVLAADVTAGTIANTAGVTSDEIATPVETTLNTPVFATADLSVIKTVNNPAPAAGDPIVFTVTVNNAGPSSATNVLVSDLLPSGFAYDSDDSGAYVPATGVWTIGAITAGNNAVINITAIVNVATGAPNEYLNIAQVIASDQPDPNSTPNNDDGDQSEDDEDSVNVVVDSDGDGIPDTLEPCGNDRDGDGIEDCLDFDPLGYFYCEDTGQIIPGGEVSFTPAVGTNLIADGSTGRYQAFFTLLPGTYTMNITVPPGTALSTARPDSGAIDPTGGPDPFILGDGEAGASGFITDFSAATNTPWYTEFNVEAGDPFIINNNIPLTNCATFANPLLLSKTAAPSEISIGDVVQYTLQLENTGSNVFSDIDLVDNIPGGFNYVDDSALIITAGPDNIINTSDDIETVAVVTGGDPITFNDIGVDANDIVLIRYLLRVSSGVVEGEYVNTAQALGVGGVEISNEASATVRVIQDPILQRTTIIGKVFNDRDEDGWQDDARATGVKIKSDHFGWNSHAVGTIGARSSELESLDDYQVSVRMPLNLEGDNSFHVVTNEGTLIKIDNDGNITEEHSGKKAKGLTGQDIIVSTVRDKDDLVITITNHGIHEMGIPGVRLATVEGLLVETDQHGRYHLADIDGGRWERGRNFIIKVDDKTLPEGSTFTTENPRVLRITQSLLSKFNFGVKLPPQQVEYKDGKFGVATRVEREVEVVETREIKDVIDPVYFKSGKAGISRKQIEILQAEIDRLQDKENVVVRVVGHADSQQLNEAGVAKFGDNHGLARSRAEKVAAFLSEKLNIRADGITVEERGAEDPIASNETEQGRAKNRRTAIDVVYDDRFTKTVIDIDYVPTKNPVLKRQATIPNGGAIWAVEDPATLDPRLNASALGGIVLESGKVTDSVRFNFYSNYLAFIDRWELAIYANNDRDLITPIDVIEGKTFVSAESIEWDAQSLDEKYIHAGESLYYVLRVFDAQGRMDETAPRALTVTDENIFEFNRTEEDEEEVAAIGFGESNLIRQTIPLSGSRIRVNGIDLDDDYTVTVNGERVVVDEDGKFVLEQHLPIGTHKLKVNVTNNDEINFDRELDVDVTGKYMFIVGLANLTIGQNSLSGSVEALGDDDHFDEDIWVDGRLAFYLKGKIKGKYLVTAQLDTTEDELRNLGDRLEEEDPTAVFRRLDPERFYAVYGDDSTTIDDTDSQGAFYLRVDWDKSLALWGNYNTDLTGTEFAQYNRSLYGVKFEHRNIDTTSFGEHKHEVHLFGSEAQTAAAHNEFIATGGSLYFLRDTDVVQGSEKVWVEVRARDTEQIVENITLEHGRDFDIDYIQGRIILTRPLTQFDIGSGPNIIRDTPLDGNDVFLLADYEYIPDAFSADDITKGGRGKAWINEYIALGGTYVDEKRDGVDYELKGADVTLRAGKGTYLRLEYAESDARQTDNNFLSANGGISFVEQNTLSDDSDGEAVGVEARINFAEFEGNQEGYVMGWWKDRDAGFSSTARLDDGIETLDTGVEAQWQATDKLELTGRATRLERKTQSEFNTLSIQGNYDVSDKLRVGLELRHEDEEDEVLGEDGEATLLGSEIRYDITEQTEIYIRGQFVVDDKGEYESNALGTVGIETQVSERLALKTELITGDRGDAVVLGAEYDVTPNMNISLDAGFGSGATTQVGTNYTTANGLELYGAYAVDPDRTDSGESMFTFGSRKRYGNGLSLYSENQFGEGEEQQSVARTYGLDFDLTEQWRLSASVQKNDIEDDLGDIDRRAATLGASYRDDNLKFGSVLEYREDGNEQSNEDATQWLTSNTLEWQQSESLRWLGKVELSTTHSDANKSDEAKYAELDLGFAYRPAFNDRLNILGKYTFIYDLASSGQDTSLADQRSHIFAIEALYDLNQKWEVGGKLAYRTGDTRVTRGSGPWFETGAHLAVARARYHMLKKWDALFEYRWLETEGEDDNRQGALAGIYRHVGDNLKVGVGYNFTDFSDDLTDNDYDSNGWFFDITGKY